MAAPTKEAIIGTFINGRNSQNDFLQLAENNGGTIFAWIDYQGFLQGNFALGLTTAWSAIQPATGNLVLNNAGFSTEFDQTSAVTWSWVNITPATGYASASNSPILALVGSAWNGSSAVPDSFGFQNKLSGSASQVSNLTLSKLSGNAAFSVFTVDSSINQVNFNPTVNFTNRITVDGIQSQSSGFDGATFNISSCGNASLGLTAYTATTTFLPVPPNVGSYVTISGFTNSANNGRFLVENSSGSTLTVWNASGVAETHAATSVTDEPYGNGIGTTAAGWKCIDTGANLFPILGTSYTVNMMAIALPNNVSFSVGMSGNATDAGFLRIVSNEGTVGPTGNHGLEIGAIVDGTGTTPVLLHMGVFDGFTGILIPQPIAATSLANQNSYPFVLQSKYWNGSASTLDDWSIQAVIGTGATPTSILTFAHTGSGGASGVNIPRLTNASGVSSILLPSNNQISIVGPDTGSINFLEGVTGFQGGQNQIQFSMFETGAGPHGIWMTNAGSRATVFANTDNGSVYMQNIIAQNDTLTQVTVSGGSTTYTGTFSNGAANGLAGYNATISGFTNGGNNVNATIVTSSNVAITVSTTTQVNETHAGTAIININAPALSFAGSYWNGSAFTDDITTVQNLIGAGTSPTSVLTISNSGAASWGGIAVKGALTSNTMTLTAATPTGASGQVSLGTTTATSASAGSNGDVPAQVVGYLTIDIAGTKFKVPYYAV